MGSEPEYLDDMDDEADQQDRRGRIARTILCSATPRAAAAELARIIDRADLPMFDGGTEEEIALGFLMLTFHEFMPATMQ